jgi:hypothetical protein
LWNVTTPERAITPSASVIVPRKKSGSLVDMCATTEPAGFSRKLGSTIVVLSPTRRCPDASKTSTTTVPSLSRTRLALFGDIDSRNDDGVAVQL